MPGLSQLALRACGWTAVGPPPTAPKFVLIAAPHTSNWDLALLVATERILKVKLSWVGKHTLFRGPMGWVMRGLGGIPVDRRSRHNMVDQLVSEFARQERLALAVPPEGTRARAPYWKSGFYHIARGAGVPIVFGFIDAGRKQVGFGPTLQPTGNLRADMDVIRDFYSDKQGIHPDNVGPIRLRDEDEHLDAAPSVKEGAA